MSLLHGGRSLFQCGGSSIDLIPYLLVKLVLLVMATLLEGGLGVQPHPLNKAVVSGLYLSLHSRELIISLRLDVMDGTQHLLQLS